MSGLQFAKINWDEKGEIGESPIGHYHIGIVNIINSRGNLSTNLLGVINPNKELIGAGLPNIATAVQIAEGHYQQVLQALISKVNPTIEESVPSETEDEKETVKESKPKKVAGRPAKKAK